jgi:hypothetical protein
MGMLDSPRWNSAHYSTLAANCDAEPHARSGRIPWLDAPEMFFCGFHAK